MAHANSRSEDKYRDRQLNHYLDMSEMSKDEEEYEQLMFQSAIIPLGPESKKRLQLLKEKLGK